jgi:hypothetical protein
MGNTVRAYHFVGKTLRDGTPIPSDGVTLVYPGKIECCHAGYHASLQPFDALQYAPGAILCLVDCGGKIILQKDKLVAEKRTIVARINATDLLYAFARHQALSVTHLWNPPKVVMDYLNTGEVSLRDAARAAARAAAWAAAWAAARDAAWAAARKQFNSLVEAQFKGL